LSGFEELRRREAARAAILYAFNLIEPDGEDLRNLPFLNRKAALAWLPRETEADVLVNEHVVKDGLIVFAHACRLGTEASSQPARAVSGLRSAIPLASPCSQSAARFGIGEPRAARVGDRRNHAQ
jgi:hypothetical protein